MRETCKMQFVPNITLKLCHHRAGGVAAGVGRRLQQCGRCTVLRAWECTFTSTEHRSAKEGETRRRGQDCMANEIYAPARHQGCMICAGKEMAVITFRISAMISALQPCQAWWIMNELQIPGNQAQDNPHFLQAVDAHNMTTAVISSPTD